MYNTSKGCDYSSQSFIEKLRDNNKTYYIVCLDFTVANWQNREAANCEIIEFGAMLVDLRNYGIVSEFHEYVRPTLHPKLSDHCKRSTGITQHFIDSQHPFPVIYRNFIDWLGTMARENDIVFIEKCTGPYACNVPNNHATFFIWGRWNLSELFRAECQRNSINPPNYLKRWIDGRKELFEWALESFHGTIKEAMIRLKIEHTNDENSAINRTEQLAKLAIYYSKKPQHENHLRNPNNRVDY